MIRRALPVLLALAVLAPVASAGERLGAVLMVEDSGTEVTERLGDALYSRFLEAAPYAKVVKVIGDDSDEGLAAAVVEVAAEVDQVDVFCSIHTTHRSAESLLRLIPPAARKLRLVYSTACDGAEEEKAAWVALRPRTLVTHVGINVPVVALPYVLSGWLAGRPIGELAAGGYTETLLTLHFAMSVPAPGVTLPPFDSRGSQPVVTGDAGLCLGAPCQVPDALRYDRRRGGSIGLVLRALAGRFEASPAELRDLLERVELPAALLPPEALARVQRLGAGLNGSGEGRVELGLSAKVEVPFEGLANVRLVLSKEVTLTPRVVDPESRTVVIKAGGVWLKYSKLGVRVSRLKLVPDGDGGYKARLSGGLLGFIPVWKTLRFGGSAPAIVLETDTPVLEELPEAQPGLVGSVP